MSENGHAGNAESVSPVDRVIEVFGWPRACEIAGLTPSALQKWKRALGSNGGGGLVPARLQARYLREAEADGLALTPRDLIAEPRA